MGTTGIDNLSDNSAIAVAVLAGWPRNLTVFPSLSFWSASIAAYSLFRKTLNNVLAPEGPLGE